MENGQGAGGRADQGDTADGSSGEPFRESGSGDSYAPDASWGAERSRGSSSRQGGANGMEGAPSGAGDGGFGPEGDYSAPRDKRVTDVLGQVNGNEDALTKEAQERGPRREDRRFTGGEGVDEPDGRD